MDLTLRPLDPANDDDRATLQELIAADPAFSERTTGRLPRETDAAELLTEAPPGVAPDRKVVLGAFGDDGRMLAVVDLVRGWPEAQVALVGLLQVRPDAQGRGVGRRTHDLVLERLRSWPEITELRAAIVTPNAAHAEPFWSAMGYAASGAPVPYRTDDLDTTAGIWVRAVPD